MFDSQCQMPFLEDKNRLLLLKQLLKSVFKLKTYIKDVLKINCEVDYKLFDATKEQ